MASQWIWPFELLDKLGEGGMGVVYRARYVGNNRMVAVKMLPEEVAQNPTFVARFDRELEILAQLRHPNIVHCFGGTTKTKQRFYAMELIDGGTLAQALRAKGKFSWDYVVEYGIQMCAALQYAHEREVIHRDLKPANFLLTKGGKLKLSDFGLATIVAGQRLTMVGKTAGTFLYMAPEQIRGKPPLSNRTDLYALGCVFFELLTGRPPFMADAPAEVLHKHLKEVPPRLSSLLYDCPVELELLISDLLQKDPELRPGSAAEVEQRLKGILRPSISHVDPMARTPSAAAIPVVATPSDDDLLTPPLRRRPAPQAVCYLYVAVIAMSLLAAWGWWSAYSAAHRERELTGIWLTAAATPGPAQIPALELLAQLSALPAEGRETLLQVVEGEASPTVRVAALKTLARHPGVGQSTVTRLLSIERTEAEATVRQELAQTRQILQDSPRPASRIWGWFRLAAILAILVVIGWGVKAYWPLMST